MGRGDSIIILIYVCNLVPELRSRTESLWGGCVRQRGGLVNALLRAPQAS